MSRLAIGLQGFAESIGSDRPVRRVPDAAAVLDHEHLRRLVPHPKAVCDPVRQFTILNNENHTVGQILNSFDKISKVLIGLRADRTPRAMLEYENGIGFGPLQELFEILILP